MPKKGWSAEEKIVPIEGLFGIDGHPFLPGVTGEESPMIVRNNKDLVAHILNEDQTINFMKLIVLLEGNAIVSFLEEQREKGNEKVFYNFLDFLKQEFFWKNETIREDIISLIRENSILRKYIIPYIKEKNHQVLSEQNTEQYEIISFHLFLLGANQDMDLVQDIHVKKFEQIKWLFAQYSCESGNISGKTEMNVWAKNEKTLRQELDLYLDFYIELCETIIKLGVIHSVNLEERKIAFDLSSEIKSHTKAIFDKLKKSFEENPKINTLKHTIWRSMVNFARRGGVIDGKTREEIKKQVIAIKKEQKEGLDMMVSSQFWWDLVKEKIFSIVFLWEWTCTELIWLEKIEKIYGELNDEEKQRKTELQGNLLAIYNSKIEADIENGVLCDFGIDTDIETSASAIDAFVTKDYLENEYQIETIYHIVCFDKSLDETILGPLLYFLITKKEFPNALYEQFAVKIVEQIIKVLTKIGTKKIPEIHNYIDQTFLYLQGKNSSNFILGHSRIYTALARYYLGFTDKISIFLAQKAFLHYLNLSSEKEGDIMQMYEKEQQFYTLLWERYFESLWITTQHSNEEKEKIGRDIFMKFSERHQITSINTINTEMNWLISQIRRGGDVYSAKQINEDFGRKIAEKFFDNLCTVSIIGECKNCAHRAKLGDNRVCKNDRIQCQSRKMKKWFQAEYIDISHGLSIQFVYPVVSARVFERIFVQKRETLKTQFDDLIAVNMQKEKDVYLAFHDRETGLPNRNKLEEDILDKERTLVFFEVTDYDTIHSLQWGREDWIMLSKKIAEHFGNFKWTDLYFCEERTFCLIFPPESIKRVSSKDNNHIGNLIAMIMNGLFIKLNTTCDRSIQFYTWIAVWRTKNHTKDAHIALTEAKDSWENVPYVFKDGDEKKPEQDRYFADILQKALNESNEEYSLIPHYQRIYYPSNPQRQCVEALARIEVPSEEGKRIITNADGFLRIAKKQGRLPDVTKEMTKSIIVDMKKNKHLEAHINLLEQDWNNNDIMDMFRWLKKEHGIHPERITIEILEGVLLKMGDIKKIEELKQLWFRIAIDDYGTNGWSASKIKDLWPHEIKLDRDLVEDLWLDDSSEKKQRAKAIIKTTVDLANEIGATITAEYVENKRIFDELQKLGVDGFQWWLFAKAVPIKDVPWGELKAA